MFGRKNSGKPLLQDFIIFCQHSLAETEVTDRQRRASWHQDSERGLSFFVTKILLNEPVFISKIMFFILVSCKMLSGELQFVLLTVFHSLLCLIIGRLEVQAECNNECCNVSDLKAIFSHKSSAASRDCVICTLCCSKKTRLQNTSSSLRGTRRVILS